MRLVWHLVLRRNYSAPNYLSLGWRLKTKRDFSFVYPQSHVRVACIHECYVCICRAYYVHLPLSEKSYWYLSGRKVSAKARTLLRRMCIYNVQCSNGSQTCPLCTAHAKLLAYKCLKKLLIFFAFKPKVEIVVEKLTFVGCKWLENLVMDIFSISACNVVSQCYFYIALGLGNCPPAPPQT